MCLQAEAAAALEASEQRLKDAISSAEQRLSEANAAAAEASAAIATSHAAALEQCAAELQTERERSKQLVLASMEECDRLGRSEGVGEEVPLATGERNAGWGGMRRAGADLRGLSCDLARCLCFFALPALTGLATSSSSGQMSCRPR